MAHIIESIKNQPTQDTLAKLKEAHAFIASQAIKGQNAIGKIPNYWGLAAKRMLIDLEGRPEIIGKSSEKFVELINILATTERTIEALEWLAAQYPDLTVRECHPSTSDFQGGNDIVLVDQNNEVKVRCEVCDVASSKPGQNGKEKKDLGNLGCSETVPSDGIDRFIATSNEFAAALAGSKRKWSLMHYRFRMIETKLPQQTTMLFIMPPEF
ncbi:hypothetical protein ACFL3I_02150 [Pseudomonadota bacterium]